MQPQGSTMLKVTGILMIIGAGLGLFGSLGLLALGGLFAASGVGIGLAAIAAIASIIAIAASALQLIAGILGVKNWNKPEKASICIILGSIILGANVLSTIYDLIMGSSFGAELFGLVIGAVIPVIYIVGAVQLKKMAQ